VTCELQYDWTKVPGGVGSGVPADVLPRLGAARLTTVTRALRVSGAAAGAALAARAACCGNRSFAVT
jgi:hypothetical protein